MRKKLPLLLRLIGPTLLLIFLLKSDLQTLWAILSHANLIPILVSLFLVFPFLLLKGWRWREIVREFGLVLPIRTAAGLYSVGVYLGSITPGQSGDLVKAWYVRQRGLPLAPGLLSVFIDRLFDLIVMSVLATLGIFALGKYLPSRTYQTMLVIAMGTGLTITTFLLIARRPRLWMFSTLLPAMIPQRLHTSLERWNKQLATLAMHPRLLLKVSIISLISAFFTFLRLWLLFIAVHASIPLSVVIGASALIAVLQVLPISIAGMGIRDGVLIAILLPYGYSTEQALSLSALFLLLTFQHIVVGFLVSFWYPITFVTSENA